MLLGRALEETQLSIQLARAVPKGGGSNNGGVWTLIDRRSVLKRLYASGGLIALNSVGLTQGDKSRTTGIDISKWAGEVDWNGVASKLAPVRAGLSRRAEQDLVLCQSEVRTISTSVAAQRNIAWRLYALPSQRRRRDLDQGILDDLPTSIGRHHPDSRYRRRL
jgi:hypothetical protein